MKGSIIIAPTEFCQAQFKKVLAEPSVAMDINPAGFSLVCPNQELFQVVLPFPSLKSFGKNQNFKWFTQVPALFLPNRNYFIETEKTLAELCQAQLKLGPAKQV